MVTYSKDTHPHLFLSFYTHTLLSLLCRIVNSPKGGAVLVNGVDVLQKLERMEKEMAILEGQLAAAVAVTVTTHTHTTRTTATTTTATTITATATTTTQTSVTPITATTITTTTVTTTTTALSYEAATGSGAHPRGCSGQHTHKSVGLGTDGETRQSIYACGTNTASKLLSATIAGRTAAILAQALGPNGGHRSMIIMADTSSAGTTGDVVLNWENGGTETSSGVMYAVYNAASAAYDSATPAGTIHGSATTITAKLNVPDNGLVIAASFAGCDAAPFPTWSGWKGVGEDKEQTTETLAMGGVGASKAYANGNGDGAPVDITTIVTGYAVKASLAVISLGSAK